MKRIFLILSLFAVMANLYATDVISVIRQKGWLETAMLQWTPVEGAAKYSVSYSGEGVSGNADDMLIRTYPDYVRCDIPGLKAGAYTLAVKALDDKGNELAVSAAQSVTVMAHSREGYAFTEGVSLVLSSLLF